MRDCKPWSVWCWLRRRPSIDISRDLQYGTPLNETIQYPDQSAWIRGLELSVRINPKRAGGAGIYIRKPAIVCCHNRSNNHNQYEYRQPDRCLDHLKREKDDGRQSLPGEEDHLDNGKDQADRREDDFNEHRPFGILSATTIFDTISDGSQRTWSHSSPRGN